MEVRRDVLLGVGALFVLNLLIAFVAIALFSRMGPVIDRIQSENVYSVAAGQQMLAALARAEGPLGEAESRAFDQALERARSNVTEPAEREPLDRLTELREAAASGTAAARAETVKQIEMLTAINYRAMAEADREALRLGQAGAWFSVFIAGFALVVSLVAVRRLDQRLVQPIRELWATLQALRAGDTHRRCSPAHAPVEFGRIFAQVHEILDQQTKPRPWSDRHAKADHAVVLWAIGANPQPTFVVDQRGQIFAANGPAHELLGGPHGAVVRAALGKVSQKGPSPALPAPMVLEVTPVPDGQVWVCSVLGSSGHAQGGQ